MSNSNRRNPYILVIPYPAQGHVIPLLELSKYLAKQSFKITFVSTQQNQEMIMKLIPSQENHISVVTIAVGSNSGEIMRAMPAKIEEMIESDGDKIRCIVADQSIGWALELAQKKGIHRAAFCPAAAAQLVVGFSIPQFIQHGIIDHNGTPTNKDQIVKLSPSMPAMKASNFVWANLGNMEAQKAIFKLMINNNNSVKLTDWLLCNSTYELEPAAFNLAPHILPIGPISSFTTPLSQQDTSCLKWLDQYPPKSVVYIAFGSTAILNPTQLQELAFGLELSSRPFLWVVTSVGSETKSFLEGFEMRIGSKGKLVRWAPQREVLSHDSVGCFMSHCGWNSTIEGVSNGMPFLCWPYFADQFLNEGYICEVWRIGLGFERDENGMIVRGEIKSKVEKLLGDGEVRARALCLKEKVHNCVKQGGSSYQNLDKFVKWLHSI